MSMPAVVLTRAPDAPAPERAAEASPFRDFSQPWLDLNDKAVLVTGGTGSWSIHRFLYYCDAVHSLGRGVGFLGYGRRPTADFVWGNPYPAGSPIPPSSSTPDHALH